MKGNIDNYFAKPVTDIIKERVSVRTYEKKPLSAELATRIIEYLRELSGPFDVNIRYKLLDMVEEKEEENLKLGTYGVIKGASAFIAAAVENKPYSMEQLGYQMEWLILYLTSLGLGTCWLAGTFSRNSFIQAMECGKNEVLPVVVPVGIPKERRSLLDAVMRSAAGSARRKQWEELFFNGNFHGTLDTNTAGEYAIPLEMVRLAPSASNKQPWRFLRSDGQYHIYICHTPYYSRAFSYDIQKIDIGIAMLHFEATARELGLKGRWDFKGPNTGLPENYEYIISWIPA